MVHVSSQRSEVVGTASVPRRWQFSITRLFGIVTVYAVMAANFGDMPIRLFYIAAVIVTVCVLGNLILFRHETASIPRWRRILLTLALFSACLSLCNFVGLLIHFYLPEAKEATQSKTFWQAIVALVDGTVYREFMREFGRALGIILKLWLGTASFALVGTLFSVACLRHSWAAWALAGINIGLLGNFFVFWILNT